MYCCFLYYLDEYTVLYSVPARHKWEGHDEIVFDSDEEAIIAQKIIEEFIG